MKKSTGTTVLAILGFAVVVLMSEAQVTISQTELNFGRQRVGQTSAVARYSAGFSPSATTLADFNEDGNLDLAISHSDGANVGVLLGNGDGTLRPIVFYPTVPQPWSIASADINNDGHADLIVGSNLTTVSIPGSIGIMLGMGDGTFQPSVSVTVPGNWFAVTIADLNSDGNMDVLLPNAGGNNLKVLIGNGDGTFAPYTSFSTGLGAWDAAIADLNGDEILDVALTAFNTGNLEVKFGTGTGAFGSSTPYFSGDRPRSIVAADVDDDGNVDLISTNMGGNTRVYRNAGTGTFTPIGDYATGAGQVVATDVDNDGKVDILVLNGNLTALRGDGTGTFQPMAQYELRAGGLGKALSIGDLDGDGWLDAAAGDRYGFAAVLLNDSTGVFQSRQFVSLTNAGSSTATLTYGIGGSNASDFLLLPGACSSVSPGATCFALLEFTPTAAGLRAATLTITNNGEPLPAIGLAGYGIAPDSEPPVINCASPDSLWHSSDVSIECTAEDLGSGLADASNASFALSTAVSQETEDADAHTNSREVCDLGGNCSTAGPIAGNKIDKKAPVISLVAPLSGSTYKINEEVIASYGCDEHGSGLASCIGPVESGGYVDTASAGTKTFTVNAADQVGNTSSASATYTVGYGLCLLYEPTKVHKSGSTIPIKVALCDASQNNVSSASVTVTAILLTQLSTNTTGVVEDSGVSNPDNNFRYDAALGGYIFNLKTSGLNSGTWAMTISVSGDPTAHSSEVTFQIRN